MLINALQWMCYKGVFRIGKKGDWILLIIADNWADNADNGDTGSSSTLLHILCTHVNCVYFALIVSHALGA